MYGYGKTFTAAKVVTPPSSASLPYAGALRHRKANLHAALFPTQAPAHRPAPL